MNAAKSGSDSSISENNLVIQVNGAKVLSSEILGCGLQVSGLLKAPMKSREIIKLRKNIISD